MFLNLKHHNLLVFEPLSQADADNVLVNARLLRDAAQAGTTQALLRGKNLGLLCEFDDADAALFRRAAVTLGAHVAHIRPSLSELSTPQQVENTARLLGRLYDAVECQGMAPALVQQMGDAAGVPVFDGVATPTHPTARLAVVLGGDRPTDADRCCVLQAVLLATIS